MKHRTTTLARSAQRALKLSLRQAETALLESLDAFDYSHEIQHNEHMLDDMRYRLTRSIYAET